MKKQKKKKKKKTELNVKLDAKERNQIFSMLEKNDELKRKYHQ